MRRPTKEECRLASNPIHLQAAALPIDVRMPLFNYQCFVQQFDESDQMWINVPITLGICGHGIYRIKPEAEEPMNKPTKEECRQADNECEQSFQQLAKCEQQLMTKYREFTQVLDLNGQWAARDNPRSTGFNRGGIYRLDPAAAEPEGPSDEELELCRNPLMRVLAATPECTETLKKWPRYVQSISTEGTWTYTCSGIFPCGVYRLVKETYDANY
jgi:hypothetical protein